MKLWMIRKESDGWAGRIGWRLHKATLWREVYAPNLPKLIVKLALNGWTLYHDARKMRKLWPRKGETDDA